ncbi:hypothetical protein FNYG_15630 [Fusarium nygamai]|uniref:Peptidase S8/S53 domain-containing protein n=1 Tax=Gibberella nygamai TaxID=42673 RepID=A0A2K0U9G0_GIBNY|nr:hypothetical protein FNYG_15630 [Fusarium nygamai]
MSSEKAMHDDKKNKNMATSLGGSQPNNVTKRSGPPKPVQPYQNALKLLEAALKDFPGKCVRSCVSWVCYGQECRAQDIQQDIKNFESRHLSKLRDSAEIRKDARKKKTTSLLHIMINTWGDKWEPEHTRLLRWMLQYQEFAGLLEKKDQDDTPLHKAFTSTAMEDVVQSILEVIHARGSISMINLLKKANAQDNNCFHLAVENQFPGLYRMLDICPEKESVLVAKNKSKDTPLHIAVRQIGRLEQHTSGAMDLYQELQEQEWEALRADNIESNLAHGQAHYIDKVSSNIVSNSHQHDNDGDGSASTSHDGNSQWNGQDDAMYELYHDDEDFDKRRKQELCRMLEDLDKGVEKPTAHLLEVASQEEDAKNNSMRAPRDLPPLDAVRQLIEACSGALAVKNSDERTPYQQRESILLEDDILKEVVEDYANKPAPSGKQRSTSEVEQRRDRANRHLIVNDPDAHYIRSYCLRNFESREETIKRLYKPGQERQIEFDLAGMPTQTIQQSYLKRLEKHLSQYSKQNKEQPQRDGRSDLVTIFKWLWKNGVREIIKVIVIDDQNPPHADAAIVEALYGFKVVEWDWKRVDLCSDVIYESSTDICEVLMYSSGNNAVLMGWASAEGFRNRQKFPNLKRITIYIRNGLEDSSRRDSNGERCKKMIEELSEPKIRVDIVPDENKISYSSEFHNATEGKNDPWIESVEAFSTFLRNASQDEDTAKNVSPIKIAIIDDGVDNTAADLETKVVGGATFCPYPHSSEYANSYFVPSGRHGTLMAQLICRLCPNVQLYVARLEELPTATGSGRRITASSAAKAVRWAINCGVNIISMSWTIRTNIQNDPDMKAFEGAIGDASGEDILMFCSASDQGEHTPGEVFPGAWGQCIRIGGATFAGDRLTWVDNAVEFWFPGRNVPFRSEDGKAYVYESGSSVATAAASGLAAVILSADQLVSNSPHEKSIFQSQKQMSTTFQHMATGNDKKFPRTKHIFIDMFQSKLDAEKKREDKGKRSTRAQQLDLKELGWDSISKEALRALLCRIQSGV